ncbi:MAG: rhodanese-like domain-containing protein [Blastocatellia bacterium]|nr:rhodanese-like domain-containing protein [Blastocatellia bacterium]
MNMILKLGAGALIVGTAIMAGGCANSDTSSHAAGSATASAAPASSGTSAPSYVQNAEEKMPRISVEEAKKMVAEGKAVLIDVRNAESYKTSHIKGAPNVPLSKLEAGDFNDLPKDKLIIAYCG